MAARSLRAVVRREATDDLNSEEPKKAGARRFRSAGVSPVPVSAEAPGSRPQESPGDRDARAGYHKPARRREPRSGEQARGPQHQVKPAASTEEQSGGRAAHVTAKATPAARAPERADGPGGVWRAARAQGSTRNTRDPSAPPLSRQGGSSKSKTKSSAAQRESEGVVVPTHAARAAGTNAATNNAAGGKGPWVDRAHRAGSAA